MNSQVLDSDSWSIISYINLVRWSDNNIFNYAPIITVISSIDIQVNQTTVVPVSVSDADGDIVQCLWANAWSGIAQWDSGYMST